MFLTYATFLRQVKIYAWREAICAIPCTQDGQGVAMTFIHRLEEGDVDAAVQCAKWLIANKPDRVLVERFSLGPRFYFEAGLIYQMDGKAVREVLNV